MSEIILEETFEKSTLDPRLTWYCPPRQWVIEEGRLVIQPDEKTDYWQKTHYGFAVDNGHFLYLPLEGDFVLSTRVDFSPVHQYDQAGLMVRLSPETWLKTSVEYEPHEPANRLGAVVTNHGYSDWSTQDYPNERQTLEVRLHRQADDYIVEVLDIVSPGAGWTQIRMAHLHHPGGGPVQCGLYACSPIGAGFRAAFNFLRVERP